MSDLYDFMRQLSANLAAEYNRIQRRVRADPGLAGAEGEESWATLLRGWLPAMYHVVTRGRVVNSRGDASPEVDVLVLHPAYPRHLLQHKYYLAAGVVAVFECKLTLRKRHLSSVIRRCSELKRLAEPVCGTPFGELNRGPIFGLLAHSHEWKKGEHGYAFSIFDSLQDCQFDGIQHPSEMLDVACIAGTSCYGLAKDVLVGPYAKEKSSEDILADHGAKHGVATAYVCTWEEDDKPYMGTALGNLISDLMHRLARRDETLRPLTEYYAHAGMASGGLAQPSLWKTDILSLPVRRKLQRSKVVGEKWSHWSPHC